MTPEESLRICRLAKALSPAQAVDEFTPDAWYLILRDHRYVDAEQVLVELGAEQEWIHVSHVAKRVKRIRTARISAYGELPPAPDGLCAADEHAWRLAILKRIGDGEHVERPTLVLGRRPDALELVKGAANGLPS